LPELARDATAEALTDDERLVDDLKGCDFGLHKPRSMLVKRLVITSDDELRVGFVSSTAARV
jgi:hypothetical protein